MASGWGPEAGDWLLACLRMILKRQTPTMGGQVWGWGLVFGLPGYDLEAAGTDVGGNRHVRPEMLNPSSPRYVGNDAIHTAKLRV